MPNTGIEPAALRSLARRSNQLIYAAAYKLMMYIKAEGDDYFNIKTSSF